MQSDLNGAYQKECYASVEYFQLKSIDLPDMYEKAIQHTEVMKQDIQKSKAEKEKVLIELDTKVKQASIAAGIKINNAEATAQANLETNLAQMLSFYKIQMSQATAFSQVKSSLQMSNPQLLDYLKAKILKEYPQDKMIIGLDSNK